MNGPMPRMKEIICKGLTVIDSKKVHFDLRKIRKTMEVFRFERNHPSFSLVYRAHLL